MVTKMFKVQLGRNIEAYIDDMVVKSKVVENHLTDIVNTFETLRKHRLKLNAQNVLLGSTQGSFWAIW